MKQLDIVDGRQITVAGSKVRILPIEITGKFSREIRIDASSVEDLQILKTSTTKYIEHIRNLIIQRYKKKLDDEIEIFLDIEKNTIAPEPENLRMMLWSKEMALIMEKDNLFLTVSAPFDYLGQRQDAVFLGIFSFMLGFLISSTIVLFVVAFKARSTTTV